jgi:predicted branched-subunit amino acid permease
MRHALYSASLAPYTKHLSQKWLLPLGFWLTDESYAVVIRHYQKEDDSPHKHWYFFGSCLLMYVNWQLCTVIGIVAGNQFDDASSLGLDFAMAVTFIGIIVPLVINRPMLLSAITAGVVGVVTNDLPNKSGLMVAAVCGIAVGYIAETWQAKQKRPISLAHDITAEDYS